MPASNGTPAEELLVAWRKSKRSNPSGNCVEVGVLPGGVAVRDSRHAAGPMLMCTPAEMAAFLARVKGGEFDHLR